MSLIYKLIVLAVMNQKGGVGKTSVSELMAEWLALCIHLRVLLADTDMQANLSERYVEMDADPDPRNEQGQKPPLLEGYDPVQDSHLNPDSNIADFFEGKSVEPRPTHFGPDEEDAGTAQGLIDIMLAHPTKLEAVNSQFKGNSKEMLTQVINKLQTSLHDDMYAAAYDIVIIDTAPTRTPLFRAALRAATHVVVPFQVEKKSIQGLLGMTGAVNTERMQRNGDVDVQLAGLIPNQVRRGTGHLNSLRGLEREKYARYLPSYCSADDTPLFIPLTTDISNRDHKTLAPDSIFRLPKSNKNRQDVERMMLHISRKVFQSRPEILARIEAYAASADYLRNVDAESRQEEPAGEV